jgi:hypothetical protein
VLHLLERVEVGHPIQQVEPLEKVTPAEPLHGHVCGRMAVDARAGLLHHPLALRVDLVGEHVGVAALLAVVDGEGVACPQRLQPRVVVDLRPGHDSTRVDGRGDVRQSLASAVAGALHVRRPDVSVVLQREVLAPHRGVVGLLGQLHDPEEGVLGLLLLFED